MKIVPAIAIEPEGERVAPARCQSMAEVRAGVDAIDRALIALLAERFGYMEAAARIKPERAQVRDEARKAQVIANARAEAAALGIPAEPIADIWDRLVEASIAYEFEVFDRTRG
jgi:isochorismate pyruvate lyase